MRISDVMKKKTTVDTIRQQQELRPSALTETLKKNNVGPFSEGRERKVRIKRKDLRGTGVSFESARSRLQEGILRV